MSGIPRTTGAPDKLVTEQLPGGGVHTFGTSQSGFTHPRFPHIKFTHVSSLSGLNVSGDKQVIANHTGSEIISSTARSRIDSGSSVSSSSSSSQSSPSSEKSGFQYHNIQQQVPLDRYYCEGRSNVLKHRPNQVLPLVILQALILIYPLENL